MPFFRNNPAGQTVFTGSATTGQTITRLLKIMTKAPTGATAANTLGEALVHEGTHMLLAIDELLSMTNNAGIPLSGGMTGAQTSFNRYVTVAASSPRRSGLITSLVTEVNRVFTPAGATRPTITATKANQAVGNVIVRILQERFAIDQQVAAYPRTVSNATVTRAYLWSLLAEETSRASWPRGPRATALETAMTLFLDDVTARLNRPTAAPSGGATTPTTPPAGSGTPKP